VQDGHAVSIRLKIGKMTCLEYAAMKGYAAILSELMAKSACYEILRQYFALDGESNVLFLVYSITTARASFLTGVVYILHLLFVK